MKSGELQKLIKSLLEGNPYALSKLITIVENGGKESDRVMDAIHSKVGYSYRIGITGPPGAGKSSIIDCLIEKLREKGKRVGIIAIDPTSPFTGGAVLGDRIRMQNHALDSGVFIRSVGSRGSHGGLSQATSKIVGLYDAAGFDYAILETVGVGQTELDVIKIVDTTVVVLVPESGDSIQTMKAGLMEIADIFVVNKSDRPGAEEAVGNLRNIVEMFNAKEGWKQPVLLTNALTGDGIKELLNEIENHRTYLNKTGKHEEKRRALRREELFSLIEAELWKRVKGLIESQKLANLVKQVEEGKISPYKLVQKIIDSI